MTSESRVLFNNYTTSVQQDTRDGEQEITSPRHAKQLQEAQNALIAYIEKLEAKAEELEYLKNGIRTMNINTSFEGQDMLDHGWTTLECVNENKRMEEWKKENHIEEKQRDCPHKNTEVRNHSLMWHDGDVVCADCGKWLRSFDAG